MNERRIIRQVIHDWNTSAEPTQGINLEPVMWETHATPEMGDRPQAIINRQLVDDCDILMGVFWTRIGSPTGVAVSGTAEEISLFVEAQKPALIYFSSVPISPGEIDIEQYRKLLEFKKLSRAKGLLGEFGTPEELRVKLRADLTRVANHLHKTLAEEATRSAALPLLPDKKTPDYDEDSTKEVEAVRVPYEQLSARDRDFLRTKALRMLMEEGATKIGPNALNSAAQGIYRQETQTVEDLRREFLAGKREALRQGRQTEDVRKAASRLPKNGKNKAKPSNTMLQTQLIFCGDNLQKLRELPDECVDLVYIDPPFNSGRYYEVFWGDAKEKRAFDDRFGAVEHYIHWMRPRVSEL